MRIGRFLPCAAGRYLSRLRHLGWEQCSHGFSSRPSESNHHQCLKAVCGLLGFLADAAAELLDGSLKLPLRFLDVFPLVSSWDGLVCTWWCLS